MITKSAGATPNNAMHWSRALIAKSMGISASSVGRIWREVDLRPHHIETCKVSIDPEFEEKVIDIVGLYVNPPVKAMLLCIDEKSQIRCSTERSPSFV